MRFHPSPEQDALQDALARLIERVCPAPRRRALMEAEEDHDPVVWSALMGAGLGGLLIPEDYGGLDLGLESAALALEVLGKAATPGPFLGHLLAGWAIAQSNDPALREEWLPALARGEAVGAIALPGWDVEAWGGDLERGALSTVIPFVPGAGQAQLIVAGAANGLAAVRAGPGVCAQPIEGFDRSRRLWTLNLDAAPVQPVGGPETSGRLVDAALVLIGADALGGAQSCLDMSVAYAKQREQFGGPIGRFQALKHQLADMALEVETGRALLWYAAHAWDQQLADASRIAALAKAHLAERFVSVSRAAVQAHGGVGYTWDYDLHLWFRRAQYDWAWLGAPSALRERAAALAGW